ncbi:MAG TPA: hypothetical protein VK539_01895 [Myxococcaceae bacterium]|nr:hypothetical protein [Myxococcaceae bacterium]
MRKKIGEVLIEQGALTEAQLRTALGQKRSLGQNHRLGSVMVAMGLITPKQLARGLSAQFDLPFVELPEIAPEVTAMISLDFQTEHRVIPFRADMEGKSERLHVAVEDPGALAMVDELRFQLRKTLRVYVAASDDIENALLMARGEKLEIVQAIALGEEDDEVTADMPIERDRGSGPPPPPREASTDFIDDLLGTGPKAKSRPPPPPSSPPVLEAVDPDLPKVPVVKFGGAAKDVKPPAPQVPPNFSEEDLKVLDNLERISKGEEPTQVTQKIMPAQMVAALVRLLIQKRIIQEEEFLDELSRK